MESELWLGITSSNCDPIALPLREVIGMRVTGERGLVISYRGVHNTIRRFENCKVTYLPGIDPENLMDKILLWIEKHKGDER